MGRGSADIGGAGRPAGTIGVGAGQNCAARITWTVVICVGVEPSDLVAAVATALSLPEAALGQAKAGAVGSPLQVAEEDGAVDLPRPVEELGLSRPVVAGAGRAAAGAASRVVVEPISRSPTVCPANLALRPRPMVAPAAPYQHVGERSISSA